MSIDLILKPVCDRCGLASELYGSACKHLTLCKSCGKFMAENCGSCYLCGTPITQLIREYNLRLCSSPAKKYFIGTFEDEVPKFEEGTWSMHREGLQGRHVTDALRENSKNLPWLLKDETNLRQFRGQHKSSGLSKYYLLEFRGDEFVAIPASFSYKFEEILQNKANPLTLREAEKKIQKKEKKIASYQRWVLNLPRSGPTLFGEKPDETDSSNSGEDHEIETLDHDFEDDDTEKGDDWDYKHVRDDDESARYYQWVQNYEEEDDDDDDEGLKELRVLLGIASGFDDETTSSTLESSKNVSRPPATKDIREFLSQNTSVALQDFADTFRPRLNFEKVYRRLSLIPPARVHPMLAPPENEFTKNEDEKVVLNSIIARIDYPYFIYSNLTCLNRYEDLISCSGKCSISEIATRLSCQRRDFVPIDAEIEE